MRASLQKFWPLYRACFWINARWTLILISVGVCFLPFFLLLKFIEKINALHVRFSVYDEFVQCFTIIFAFCIVLWSFRCAIEYKFKRFHVEFDATQKWYVIYARIFCFLLPIKLFDTFLSYIDLNKLFYVWEGNIEVIVGFLCFLALPIFLMLSFHLFSRWFHLVFINPKDKMSIDQEECDRSQTP